MTSRTPSELRRESFAGALGLAKPLNDMLVELQARIAALEARQEFAVLGPRRVEFPIDEPNDTSTVVAFALPPNWTPGVAFILGLEATDAPGVPQIQPYSAEFRFDESQVIVTRLSTATITGHSYNLTLGVTRGR